MKNYGQSGFSLIELLLVIVIIGIISAIGIPSLKKARVAAENGGVLANLRAMSTLEVDYFSHNNRFARLSELNAAQSNNLGTVVAPGSLVRSNITYTLYNNSMSSSPTDTDLQTTYKIVAVRPASGTDPLYTFEMTSSGVITQLTP